MRHCGSPLLVCGNAVLDLFGILGVFEVHFPSRRILNGGIDEYGISTRNAADDATSSRCQGIHSDIPCACMVPPRTRWSHAVVMVDLHRGYRSGGIDGIICCLKVPVRCLSWVEDGLGDALRNPSSETTGTPYITYGCDRLDRSPVLVELRMAHSLAAHWGRYTCDDSRKATFVGGGERFSMSTLPVLYGSRSLSPQLSCSNLLWYRINVGL